MAASFRFLKLWSSNPIFKLPRLFFTKESIKASVIWKLKPEFQRIKFPFNNFLLTLVPVFTATATDADTDKAFEPDDIRLRSSECLKNAAGLAVDSTSAVLSQTVYAIIKVEKEYVELLNVLVKLLEYQMQILGQKPEEDRISDIIIETRHEINEVKKRKEDLALLFASVEKLADATAEVAFASGCSYASTSAGERLYSAQQEVKRNQEQSERAEKDVAYAEAQMIDKISRHETLKNKRPKQDDSYVNNDHDSDSNTQDNPSDEMEETMATESQEGEYGERFREFDTDSNDNDSNNRWR